MEGSGSSGFDMSKMSTADRWVVGGSILLLIVSFFPWQSYGGGLGELGELIGIDTNFNMWQGSGSWAGWIAGLLAIALIVVAVLSMTGTMANTNMGTMSADKVVGFLGLGVRPPAPEWGMMMAEGREFLSNGWWVATMPGLASLYTGLAFILLGDGVADLLRVKGQ